MNTRALQLDGSVAALQAAIRAHYDDLIDIYEDLWGEHIHHGYWDLGAPNTDRHAAQVRTVEELARFAELAPGGRVLDVGCGVGASSIYLAATRDFHTLGITLSSAQAKRATEKARAAGVDERCHFEVRDAMSSGLADASFDIVWALESCELMPDKATFLRECFRVLKPGGKIVVATWCCRDERLGEDESRLLQRIYRDFAAAYVLPLASYERLCTEAGFENVHTADWTAHTRNTWQLGIDIVKPFVRNPAYVWRLVRAKGSHTFRFLNSVPLMKQAYDRGLMRYGVFCAERPADS